LKKIIVRYFYSPICPESFATFKRLKILFQDENKYIFESFNTAQHNLVSEIPWFPEEKNIIGALEGKDGKPIFFGKLFIEGEEIKGFPPSPKSFKEVFSKHGLKWDPDLYNFNYAPVERKRWKCKQEDFTFQRYNENILFNVSCICTKHHPYLDEKNYRKKDWIKHEKQKESFLLNKLKENKLIGIIAYYKQEPAGFVEAFPLNVATKLGYPVSELSDNKLMITCLSVRTEVSGYGIGSKMITKLEEEAERDRNKSIEVISFPDEHNWHPISLYRKHGFKEI
jgi:ribosomal protein S18 acetylase RimI-like enzyme